MKRDPNFPAIWYRYVDNVFCVINSRQLNNFLEFSSFYHVYDRRKFGLSLKIKTTQDEKFKLSVYRKPTHTDRYITGTAHPHQSPKHVAFHTMIQ